MILLRTFLRTFPPLFKTQNPTHKLTRRLTRWFQHTATPGVAGTASPSICWAWWIFFFALEGKYFLLFEGNICLSGDGRRLLEGSLVCLCQWMGREDTGPPHFHFHLSLSLSFVTSICHFHFYFPLSLVLLLPIGWGGRTQVLPNFTSICHIHLF